MVGANQTFCPQGFHFVRESDKLRRISRIGRRAIRPPTYTEVVESPTTTAGGNQLFPVPKSRYFCAEIECLPEIPDKLQIFVTVPTTIM